MFLLVVEVCQLPNLPRLGPCFYWANLLMISSPSMILTWTRSLDKDSSDSAHVTNFPFCWGLVLEFNWKSKTSQCRCHRLNPKDCVLLIREPLVPVLYRHTSKSATALLYPAQTSWSVILQIENVFWNQIVLVMLNLFLLHSSLIAVTFRVHNNVELVMTLHCSIKQTARISHSFPSSSHTLQTGCVPGPHPCCSRWIGSGSELQCSGEESEISHKTESLPLFQAVL